MAITPISKNVHDDLDFLFEEATLENSWSDFGSDLHSRMLHVKHRDPYVVRFIGPLMSVRRYYVDKSNILRRSFNSDEFPKIVSGTLPNSRLEAFRKAHAPHTRYRSAYNELSDRSQWERGIIGNTLVRSAKDKSVIGKVLIHTLNENDIKLISATARKNRVVTGVDAFDVKIHNVGSGTCLLPKSILDSDEIKKVLRQGLHDLAEFIKDSNIKTAKLKCGFFYAPANRSKKLADSYLNDFCDALLAAEEGQEIDSLLENPEQLYESGIEEFTIAPMIDID